MTDTQESTVGTVACNGQLETLGEKIAATAIDSNAYNGNCMLCGESVEFPSIAGMDAHKECLFMNTCGHFVGICGCNGYSPTHANAILALERFHERDCDANERPSEVSPTGNGSPTDPS